MHHKFNNVVLRKYDVRGIYGEQMDEKDAYFFGLSYGLYVKNHQDKNFKTKIVIGRDGRVSSPSLQAETIKGITDAGIDVINIGLVSSPMVNFAVEYLNCIACVQITASHNPKEYNGFKFDYKNRPFFDEKILELAQIAEDCDIVSENEKGKIEELNIENEYIEHILKNINLSSKTKIKVCFDCGNGATGWIVKKLIETLKIKYPNIKADAIFTEINGDFPNHHPDPTVAKNMITLSKKVVEEEYDIGIGFDGDGDRLGIIDENGNLLYGDQELLIFAKDILQEHKGATFVSEVKASKIVYDGIKNAGGKCIMSRTGNTYIRTKIDECGALLGGETSGHIFFADKFNGVDDGVYAGLRMLEILCKTGKKMSSFTAEIPHTFSTHDLKLPIDESDKFAIIDRIIGKLKQDNKEFCDIDGVRIDNENGWWMVRASNTSNILTGRCESDDDNGLEKLKEEFEFYLKQAGYNEPINFDE